VRYRIAVIAALAGLLVTGCSSQQSVIAENEVKLIEYEKCLLHQQDNLNTVNNQLARSQSFIELLGVLEKQATNRFDIHLKNCEKYRPLTLP
jgi:hypothetical protein